MSINRLYTFLVAWCLLVIAPGVIVELGAFGQITAYTIIPNSLILLWFVGYLAQFGVFMWIMRIVGKQNAVWWFAASLLPLAIDYVLPVSPLFWFAWLPMIVGLAGWIGLAARRAESLQQHGIRATGVVLEVLKPLMNVVVNNVYIKRKVRVRIERYGAPAYEGVLNGLFMLGEIPSPGDRIPLLVDPANPQRFEYDKEERSTGGPATGGRAAGGRATSGPATPVGPIRSAVPYLASRESIADELEKLADLRDRGAISDSEFDAAKKKLLR